MSRLTYVSPHDRDELVLEALRLAPMTVDETSLYFQDSYLVRESMQRLALREVIRLDEHTGRWSAA